MSVTPDGKHFPADASKFTFDAEVTAVFDNMAARSIPGYAEAHDWILHLTAGRRFDPFGQVWDFGCSTGSALSAAMRGLNDPRLDYVGVDISPHMVDAAAARNKHARFFQHDLMQGLPLGLQHGRVAVAIFGWTLQFLPDMGNRAQLLADVYDALLPDGMLFVFEKFQFLDDELQQSADRGYYWWRRAQGYGFDEIYAKSVALQSSMFPWQHEALERLVEEFPGAHLTWLYRHYQFGGALILKGKEDV